MKGIRYSEQFKKDAVALVNSGMTQIQVCKDLGISKSALFVWVRDFSLLEKGITPPKDPDEMRGL